MDYVSPLEALFPGAAASVVTVLARSERPLTIRQIADRAGVSHPQVSHHVDRLETLGVAEREVVGRSHQVRLTASAVSALLRRLVRVDQQVLDHARNSAPELEPNAVSVTVFGSFARGTARAGSDIDVAVVAHDVGDEHWLALLSRWVDELSEVAGNPVAEILVSVEELADRTEDPVWLAIADEGVTVAGRPVTELFEASVTEGRS
jgi:predicted nucleotidyltransferase